VEPPEVAIARIQEQLLAREGALVLQTEEIHRRLNELNGEAERLRQMQATYMPRETYEVQRKDLEQKIEALLQFRANLEGRMWVAGGIVVILGAAIAAAMRFIK